VSHILILYLAGLTLRFLVFAALASLITIRMQNVSARHAVWTGVLGLLLLMPAADLLMPESMVPPQAPKIVLPVQTFVAEYVVVRPGAVAPAAETVPVVLDWWRLAAVLWVVVAGAFLCRLVAAYVEIARLKRSSRPVSSDLWNDLKATPGLRESDSVAIPLTVGLVRPVLILPVSWREWEPWKLRTVFAHELMHVRRRDWAVALTASVARSIFWFNPVAWWLERHLSSLAEESSDEACVRLTGDGPRYAETLLQFAAAARNGNRWMGGVAMAQYRISSRIERILRLENPGFGILSRAGWCGVLVVLVSSLYVSAAAQSLTRTELPALAPAEILSAVQQSLPQPQTPAPITPIAVPVATPQAPRPSPTPDPQPVPAQSTPTPPVVNPDMVGEIRLILSPVEVQAPSAVPPQVQVQTRSGTTNGTAIWNVSNSALNPNTWGRSGNAYELRLVAIEGRTLRFESKNISYGYSCPDCSFLAWEMGAGSRPGANDAGIVFTLSPDARSLTLTCRATECLIARSVASPGAATFDDIITRLQDGQIATFELPLRPLATDPNNLSRTTLMSFTVTP
jgi:beta-lactamase regulating signal transducer with metallopeptidase domain